MAAIPKFTKTKAYRKLEAHASRMKQATLQSLRAENPNRTAEHSVRTDHAYFDYSRQLVDLETIKLLDELAGERDLQGQTEAMFTGEKINNTEGRAVLHTALRQQSDEPVFVDGKDVIPEVKEVLAKIESFSAEILDGTRRGVTGKRIKNIVSIGIGGSFLGPEFLAKACRAFRVQTGAEKMNLEFVANVDGTDFVQTTEDLDPEETLFIVASKTFTTAETMKNAKSAKKWMLDNLGKKANAADIIKKHFIAASTATAEVEKFGIDTTNMFVFWDWVGGRYSSSSAIAMLPLALFLGYDQAAQVLKGACWMDNHFRTAPLEQNIPILAALIDIWNINFLGHTQRALLPYSQALEKLPAHTQQVEMESNGKSVDKNGQPVDFHTGEVVFGEPGTNGQHSFYQLIHQGTEIIPCDFIGSIRGQYELGENTATEVDHQGELNTNLLAQPKALEEGKEDQNLAKNFTGNRPSSTLLLENVNLFTAGALLAFTEIRAVVKGFIWGNNSFDQEGVELGKILGKDFRTRMMQFNATGEVNTAGLDSSSAELLTAILTGKLPQ